MTMPTDFSRHAPPKPDTGRNSQSRQPTGEHDCQEKREVSRGKSYAIRDLDRHFVRDDGENGQYAGIANGISGQGNPA